MVKKFFLLLLVFISTELFSMEQLCQVGDDVIVLEGDSPDIGTMNPKAPARPLHITVSGNTVSWNELYSFEWIQILDAETDAILFNADISTEETSVVIPSYISGEVVIRLFNGNVWYRGIVTL